jgi:hypothetical protein
VAQLTPAQKRLLAQRAARADAIRKLAEQVKGVRIDAQTTVRDFVTESDIINTRLGPVLMQGMREVGGYRHFANGICEVTMSLTLRTLIKELKALHARYYKGSKYRSLSWEKWTLHNKYTTITVVGRGAQPASADEIVAVPVPGAPPGQPQVLTWRVPPGWQDVAPQGFLMAEQAARVDASRKLAERLYGMTVSSDTTVRDFVTERDAINTSMRAFLRGHKQEGPTEYLPNQTAQVTLSVTLRQIWAAIKQLQVRHIKEDQFKKLTMTDVQRHVRTGKFIETGHGAVPARFTRPPQVVQPAVAGPQPPAWVNQPIQVTGSSSVSAQTAADATQRQLMAMRAATLDAKRKLGEQVWGLRIDATTTVKDFVATSDVIQSDLDVFLSGAHVVGSRSEGDLVYVTVQIDPKSLWDNVIMQRLPK